MIVLADNRSDIGSALAAGLHRAGMAAAAFSFDDLTDWVAAAGVDDILAVEGFVLAAHGADGPVIARLRACSSAPIIAIIDRRALDDTLALFAAGLDDVVSKPVHAREIVARVRAIARRYGTRVLGSQEATGAASDATSSVIAATGIDLPRRELRILECLASSKGVWVSKQRIFNQVYGIFDDRIDDTVIECHVSRLRKRLRQRLGRDPIESRRFLGYRLSERIR